MQSLGGVTGSRELRACAFGQGGKIRTRKDQAFVFVSPSENSSRTDPAPPAALHQGTGLALIHMLSCWGCSLEHQAGALCVDSEDAGSHAELVEVLYPLDANKEEIGPW